LCWCIDKHFVNKLLSIQSQITNKSNSNDNTNRTNVRKLQRQNYLTSLSAYFVCYANKHNSCSNITEKLSWTRVHRSSPTLSRLSVKRGAGKKRVKMLDGARANQVQQHEAGRCMHEASAAVCDYMLLLVVPSLS
jgi:hypothetical protein